MEDTLARKIKKIRELKGYSQEYLGGMLNISQRAYSKIERPESADPSLTAMISKPEKDCDNTESKACFKYFSAL